jgi:hypothetical protein
MFEDDLEKQIEKMYALYAHEFAVSVAGMITVKEWEDFIKKTADVVDAALRPPYTFVKLQLNFGDGERLIGYGFAKVSYPDVWDENQGLSNACKRAVRDIRHQIQGLIEQAKNENH